MEVAARVPLHDGAHDSVAGTLSRPTNEAKSLVVCPLVIVALPLEVSGDEPTLNEVILIGGMLALSMCKLLLALPVDPSPAMTVAVSGRSPSGKPVGSPSKAYSGGAGGV